MNQAGNGIEGLLRARAKGTETRPTASPPPPPNSIEPAHR